LAAAAKDLNREEVPESEQREVVVLKVPLMSRQLE